MKRFNYQVVMGPSGTEDEIDLATCGHCQRQMRVPPPKDGHVVSRVLPPCLGCGKYICGECKAVGGCDPWEKKMERSEARFALLKAIGLDRGLT